MYMIRMQTRVTSWPPNLYWEMFMYKAVYLHMEILHL